MDTDFDLKGPSTGIGARSAEAPVGPLGVEGEFETARALSADTDTRPTGPEEDPVAGAQEAASDPITREQPKLSLDLTRLQGPRLGTDIPDDPWSPTTPGSSVMKRYEDPNNLPGPTGTSHQFGRDWTHFGRTKVPSNFLDEHQEVRRGLASTGRGQKYLAHLERGEGLTTYVVPFRRYDGQDDVPDFGKKLTMTAPLRNGPHAEAYLVKYAVDEGAVNVRGELEPPVLGGIHEMAHASRRDITGSNVPQALPASKNYGALTNVEEMAVIRKIANPAAVVHGWGLNDSHEGGTPFEAENFTSALPKNKSVQEAIDHVAPTLQALTESLDKRSADPIHPVGVDREVSRDRHALGLGLQMEIKQLIEKGLPPSGHLTKNLENAIEYVKSFRKTPFDDDAVR